MNQPDLGQLILRLTLGVLILLHGVNKILNGVSGIEGMLASHGLPAVIAYGAYVGEVIAPLMIILGFHTRVGAALIAANMLFAFGLAHMGQLTSLTRNGGWELELQGMYLMTAVALMFLGPGRYKIHS